MKTHFRTLAALAALSVSFVAVTVRADSFLYVSPTSDEFNIGLSPTTYTVYFHSDDARIVSGGVTVVNFDINVTDPTIAVVSAADPTDVLPAAGAIQFGAGTLGVTGGASISNLFFDATLTNLLPMMLDGSGNVKVGTFNVTGLAAGTTDFSIRPVYIDIDGLGTDISDDTGSADPDLSVTVDAPINAVPLPSSAFAGITLLTLLAGRKLATR